MFGARVQSEYFVSESLFKVWYLMIFIKYETCFVANEKDIIAALQVLYGTYYVAHLENL